MRCCVPQILYLSTHSSSPACGPCPSSGAGRAASLAVVARRSAMRRSPCAAAASATSSSVTGPSRLTITTTTPLHHRPSRGLARPVPRSPRTRRRQVSIVQSRSRLSAVPSRSLSSIAGIRPSLNRTMSRSPSGTRRTSRRLSSPPRHIPACSRTGPVPLTTLPRRLMMPT